ncbi:MAG: hypothetical protein PHV78_03135 [Patescibacteria group bacterium]|nr:hypothetical protein [Patescibacteria group bacterium]MDD5396216.1 hypothetical protein [Patescibacteria group bacterium]
MNKRILLIVLFFVAVIAIALVLYFFIFRTNISAPPINEAQNLINEQTGKLPVSREQWEGMTINERASANLPLYEWQEAAPAQSSEAQPVVLQVSEIANGGKTIINPVSNDSAQSATLSFDGQNSLFYNSTDGKFYQVDKNGIKTSLSNQVFHNVSNVNWAPNKDRAIIEYPDGFKIMYDFKNQKQYTLPNNWEDFSWDSRGNQIVFKATSQYSQNNWLAVANSDGTGARAIENMGDNGDKVTVSWSPNNQVVAFSATGQAQSAWQQEVLLIGQNGENFKSLIIDGRGFETQWNPRGDSIAYSVYSADSGYKPTLYLVKAQGDEIGNDKINTGLNTWSHKCAYNSSGSYLFCAVPKSLPEGSGMMSELATNLQDNFYKINAITGEKTFLAEGAMGGYDVSQLFISGDDGTLYFIDKNSGILRYIKLR